MRLSVATSCAPPLEECPVTATGTKPSTEMTNSVAVQPQDNAARQASARTKAMPAVSAHAPAWASPGVRLVRAETLRIEPTGLPTASAMVNGTVSAAPRNQTAAAQDAVRTAAYPWAARMP